MLYADISPQDETQQDGVYVFPASLEQIRYWTLDQLDGDSTASNMAIAAALEGTLDDSLVEQSVRALVERHEALRTTFRIVDGQLSQIISEDAAYSFSITDLCALPASERAEAFEAAIEEHSHARASLADGPAFFARLIHFSGELHFLAFTMHHIVCDGWSNGILIRDFAELYGAFAQHRAPQLPELPFQFADFTVWQQKWLESDAAQSALAYWRSQIRRGLPAVDLPTDQPRQQRKSYPGHIESTLLPAELTARLKAYCRSHDTTMHQVMLAAFQALIARYANQREFLLGSTIANRTQPGMENVVGRFANPQVILADVNGDPSFVQLLARVKEWSTESYAHQDLPFSRLMEEFQLDQAGATSQFLQVYFVYQKAFMQPQEAPGLKVNPRPSVSGGVNFDLLVSVVERSEGPRLQMEYNTVIFRKERILALIDMFLRVLQAVMSDDRLTVSSLPLVSPRETSADASTEHSPANALSETASDAALGLSLGAWLDRKSESLGDATAILRGEDGISWNGLRQLSLTLSSALRSRGLAAGAIVALRLDSTVHAAAAAWALLRNGAIVLPLPASATTADWQQILATCRPALALSDSSFASATPGVTAWEDLLASPESRPADPSADFSIDPSRAAWLALDPSSSGDLTPQLSSHTDTLRQLLAAAQALDLSSGDTVLVTQAASANAAWVDLLLPLATGATSLYADNHEPERLQSFLDRHRVSFLFTSCAALLQSIQGRWPGDRRLNVVLREGLATDALATRFASTPMRLWSLLSSSATAGPLAIARLSSDSPSGYQALPSQRIEILDDNGHPAPAGVSGELNLVTHASAIPTGFLGRTSLDTGRSLGLPLRAEPRPKAGIEILDTVDRLVRLHGYRLRLGEVEDILWQSPAVADAAAAILPFDGAPALVAYLQVFNPHAESARIARNHFQATAPGHLAAAELIVVPAIPRRVDGSPNFALLPAPGSAQSTEALADECLAPRDELESSLVAIWEDVLGVRPIGIRTRFFKLGGYSLMIVRLFARINKMLGTSLPITTIFNAPTVEQLADIVRGRAYYSSLVPVQITGSRPPFFMIHSYLLYQGIPTVMGAEFPFYGLRELDTDAKDMSVEQRAATYLDAMRSIQPHGPYYIGGWCAAGPLAVETARQIVASGESVGFLVLFDSWRPGYAAQLAREQAGTAEMSFRSRMNRKYRFHRNQLRPLSPRQRARYVLSAITNKLSSVRDRIYLKNWAFAEWFCRLFGLQLPHFMHNVSLTTLNSLKEYRGVDPYTGSMTLIRAKEAPYIPGAKEHCGWDAIVTGGVNVLWAPGDHESMFLEPHLETVGRLLREGLEASYVQPA